MYGGSIIQPVDLTVSQFAQRALFVDNRPYSLAQYPYVFEMLDTLAGRTVFKTGRQITKTTMLVIRALGRAVEHPGYKTMFVLPSQRQASGFSAKRLSSILNRSPYFAGQKMPINSRWMTELPGGQQFTVVYAKENADRGRGESADEITYDEAQDIVMDLVQPILSEALANSVFQARETISGTPKNVDNPLEGHWAQSDQREWVMRCPGCNRSNYITSVRSIGLHGPICVKCGHLLNVRDGRWVAMNRKDPADLGGEMQAVGFHVPQPIMPSKTEDPIRWGQILTKLREYSDATFLNEVLGVSATIGERWVTRDTIFANSRDYDIHCPVRPADTGDVVATTSGRPLLYVGIDWGGEASSAKAGASHTALWCWGLLAKGFLKCLYYHIWPPGNAHITLREVVDICVQLNPIFICGDAGMGQHANPILRTALQPRKIPVMSVQYNSSKQLAMDGKDRLMLDRTRAIDTLMLDIKNQRLRFPRATHMELPARHFLAVFEHMTTPTNGIGKRVWQKSSGSQDDLLHAAVFGQIAAKVHQGTYEFYSMRGLGSDDV